MLPKFAAAALIAALVATAPAAAAEFTINMVNKDAAGHAMQFEPAFLKVMPGDVIHFVAVDKGHDTETLPGGIPEGAEGWKGKVSQDLTVTLTVEGLYVFKCTPHFVMGMVGLIQVGDGAANLEAIKALKYQGKAKGRIEELYIELAAAMPAQ